MKKKDEKLEWYRELKKRLKKFNKGVKKIWKKHAFLMDKKWEENKSRNDKEKK